MNELKEWLISLIPTGVSVASIVAGIKVACTFVKNKFVVITDLYKATSSKLVEHSEEIATIKDLVGNIVPSLNQTISGLQEQVKETNEQVIALTKENKALKEENESLKVIKDDLSAVKKQLVVILDERKN